MVLSDIQKQICLDMKTSVFYSVDTMLSSFAHFQKFSEAPGSIRFDTYWVQYPGTNITYFLPDRVQVRQYLLEYIALINLLEKSGLVVRTNTIKSEYITPIFTLNGEGKYVPDTLILSVIRLIIDDEIYPLKPFELFLENNFKTESELSEDLERQQRDLSSKTLQKQNEDEKLSRVKAERRTFVLAWISIIVSITSIVLNILTYTTSREVTITNPKAFNDTTKVLLLKPIHENKVDSLIH